MSAGSAPPESFWFAVGCVAAGPLALILASAVHSAHRLSCGAAARRLPVVVAAVPQEGVDEEQVAERPTPSATLSEQPRRQRILYFDAWRTLCVICVVITHADELYAEWNIGAVQQWVLQVIMVISGTCYSISRASGMHLLQYESRLTAVFSFGSAMNWLALLASGGDWSSNIADKVLFQMAFIGLMFAGALLNFPVKVYLDAPSKSTRVVLVVSFYVVVSVASIGTWIYFVAIEDQTHYEGWLRAQSLSLAMPATAIVLVTILPERWKEWVGWFLLLWLYVSQTASENPNIGYWCHLVDIYTWSVFVHRVPLKGTAEVGTFLAQCWPIWALAGALLGRFPGVRGRKDKFPFSGALDRARFYSLETLILLAFVTVPSAGHDQTMPTYSGLKRHLPWLNIWSLLAFCLHQAVYYVVQPLPWGLILVLGPLLPTMVAMEVKSRWAKAIREANVRSCSQSACFDHGQR